MAAMLIALLQVAPVSAQGLPGLPQAVVPSAAGSAPTASTAAPSATNWADRLAEARAEQERLQADPDAPAGAERRRALSRLIALLASRVERAQAPTPKTSAEAQSSVAVTLRGEPPYAVPEVDALRDQRDSLQAQQVALALTLKSLDSELEAASQVHRKAAETLRLRQELFERGRSGPEAEALQGQLELARLQSRVAELELAQADENRTAARERQARLSEPIATLEREIERVRGQQRLDDEDLLPVRNGIAAESRRLQAERTRASRELARRETQLQNGGRAAAHELEALRGHVLALERLEGIERGKEAIWELRQQVTAAGDDPKLRRDAAAALSDGIDQVQARQRTAAEQLELLRSEYRVQQSRLAAMADGEPQLADAERAASALQQQIAVHERMQEQLTRIGTLLARTRADLGPADGPSGARGWLERGAAVALDLVRRAWQYELFSATETSEVAGRVVTVDYGVTVGKTLGVLVLFVLGYAVARLLTIRFTDLLVSRAHMSPQLAQVLRRWVMSTLLLIVLLVVLRLARVPLTAFAFLGGALAIGVGFGAQNIIKNLISGAIILFERKVRVGDIVTIGGISGTVIAVDLRATTVRGFDGIESIVPNSNLLEDQVSNWSSGNPMIRRAIVVGVVYGSDTRRTIELILSAARRQPATLPDPGPQVLLDDFGSDALVFRLLYWMRLGGERPGPIVDSDIRLDIESALREAGITMAFPQRDVHLDSLAPIRVELSRARTEPGTLHAPDLAAAPPSPDATPASTNGTDGSADMRRPGSGPSRPQGAAA
jgi:small-conductance mechanosensitive channel